MKKSKKIVATVLAAAMAFSLSVSATAAGVIIEDDGSEVVVRTASETITVSDVNVLYDERSEALVRGDMVRYDEITAELRSYGVEEISFGEISQLTGDDTALLSADGAELRAVSNDVLFERYDIVYQYLGVRYDVMRIRATPNPNVQGDTILYKTGQDTHFNTRTATATGMALVGIGVETIAGLLSDTLGTALTVYGVLSDVNDALYPSSSVTNISASYTWNTAEACSWVYVSKEGLGAYELRGLYHKASASLGVTIPTLTVNGHDISTGMDQKEYTGTATPINYDSTKEAVIGFVNKRQCVSSILSVNFTGVEKQTIKNVNLTNPHTPNEAGY